jgi:acetyl esterase/lipase
MAAPERPRSEIPVSEARASDRPRAAIVQGLPPALVVTSENDPLRPEPEAAIRQMSAEIKAHLAP